MEERKRAIQKKFRLTEQENLRLVVKMGYVGHLLLYFCI